MRRLLISRPITAPSLSDYQVVNLSTGQTIAPPVQIRRHHFFSFSYDVTDKHKNVIGTLSPKNLFLDAWRIKNVFNGSIGIVSRDIPAELFTEYQITSNEQTVCVFRQSNTVRATEFVPEFAEGLDGWGESLLISVPLVIMASNPFICSIRTEAQGGSI